VAVQVTPLTGSLEVWCTSTAVRLAAALLVLTAKATVAEGTAGQSVAGDVAVTEAVMVGS
jgi:hypothetical protein